MFVRSPLAVSATLKQCQRLVSLSAVLALVAVFLPLVSGRPAAFAAQTLHLPYPAGLAVEIIQGYNGGTHTGVERYSLDLVRADGATSGSPVLAPASGSVAFAEAPGEEHGCIGVAMDDSGDLHFMLCHLILNRAYTYGDRIQQGQLLGTVAAPGLVGNNGTSHVHMQLYTLPGGDRTPVPYAPPAGIPLEGVTMPADGSYDQWACSGAACQGLTSHNGVAASGQSNAPSNAGLVPPAPPLLPPIPPVQAASAGLSAGQTVLVQGTGDCLRAHAQPNLSAAVTGCAADGTSVTIVAGPVQAGGETWWNLFNLGWSVADYLRAPPATAANSPPAATAPPLGAGSGSTALPGSSSSAPPSATGQQASVAIGSLVRVAGSGDCLRVHTAPALSAAEVTCLPDGSLSAVQDGPRAADGHTWWLLDSGWAVADYLQMVPF